MKLQTIVVDSSYSYGAEEFVILDKTRHELVGDPYGVPAGSRIVVEDQSLYLVTGEMAPAAFWLIYLLITYIVLVFAFRNERRINPSVDMFYRFNYGNFLHNL